MRYKRKSLDNDSFLVLSCHNWKLFISIKIFACFKSFIWVFCNIWTKRVIDVVGWGGGKAHSGAIRSVMWSAALGAEWRVLEQKHWCLNHTRWFMCVCVCVNRRMGQCVHAVYLLCPLLPSKRSKTCNKIPSSVCKREKTVVCNPGCHKNSLFFSSI